MKNILLNGDILKLHTTLIIKNLNHKAIHYNEKELEQALQMFVTQFFEDKDLVKIED